MNSFLVAVYLLPALILLGLVGCAARVSRRAGLAAIALGLAASLLAISPLLPEMLRTSVVGFIARHYAGQTGLGIIAFVAAWTAARLLFALAGLFSRKAEQRRPRMHGPPHGLSGWLNLLLLRLLAVPVRVASLVHLALSDPDRFGGFLCHPLRLRGPRKRVPMVGLGRAAALALPLAAAHSGHHPAHAIDPYHRYRLPVRGPRHERRHVRMGDRVRRCRLERRAGRSLASGWRSTRFCWPM